MYVFTGVIIRAGAVGIICAHVASERGWTSDWKTVQPRKKRSQSKRKVIQMSTESTHYSNYACDSAVVLSDSGDDREVADSKTSTSSKNSFACLEYFLDWDEEPDDFLIRLAAAAFLDKDDPYLSDTEDIYLHDDPITNIIDILEEIDRPLQQLELRMLEEAAEATEAMLLCVCGEVSSEPTVLEPAHQVEEDAITDWDPQDWDANGPEIRDSISQCPSKYRHEASYLFDHECVDPEYRDHAGTGLLSDAERKQRLRRWIMASECAGDWHLSSNERDAENLFQLHVMKTEHQWQTRCNENWEYDEEHEDERCWSWNPNPVFEGEDYEPVPWKRMTPDIARRMGWVV